jgi:tetratricopeptide (TPR) repeat protein
MGEFDQGGPPSGVQPAAAPAAVLRNLWEQWRRQGCPDFDDFVTAGGRLTADQALALLRYDQHQRWRNGERLPAESYLGRYRLLREDADAGLLLVYSEFALRQELGEGPALDEYQGRFPHCADGLRQHHAFAAALADAAQSTVQAARPLSTGGAPAPPAPPGPAGSGWPTLPGYEVLGELGRGGMGVVYRARQVALDRVVALKMIRAGGQAGEEERARFRTEAEAVARLQHPHIVQIHEVGEQGGLAYFFLEFCPGGSLDKKLAGTLLPPAAAAALVEKLARAMQAAHEKGVLHRDLKPANVLLAEDGTPKITDFGLAKKLGEVGQTQSGAVIGTPSYMAPEQAGGKPGAVGPTADVYALGAILYECLTGRPPFRAETPLETLLQVRTAEPVPPGRLVPKVPRDLETICLKCLHKEPHKRYASAQALAEDLHHFLAGEPIRARPVGAAGRLWRWCRRQPAAAGLAAALILGTVGGLAVTTGLYLRAREQGARAERERERAEENFRLSLRAVEKYLTNVGESAELKAVGLEKLRRDLLATAQEFYERFTRERGGDPGLRADLGQAYFRLGYISGQLGELDKAAEFYGRMQSVFAALARDNPDNPDHLAKLAMSHNDLGAAYKSAGRMQEAEANYLEARRLREQLARDQPDDPKYQAGLAQAANNLAVLYDESGRQREAEANYRQAEELYDRVARACPDVPDYQATLASTLNNRGFRLRQQGQRDEARDCHDRARRICAALARDHPGVPGYRSQLARSHYLLADLDSAGGRKAEAVKGYRHAGEILGQLVQEHPYVLDYQRHRARCLNNLGVAHLTAGELDKAEGPFQEARKGYARLKDAQPRALEHAVSLGQVCGNLGNLSYRKGRTSEAEKFFTEARDLFEAVVRDHPESVQSRSDLANVLVCLGGVYAEAGRHAEAEAACLAARQVQEKLVRDYPKFPEYQYRLARTSFNLGQLYLDTARPEDALDSLAKAVRTWEGLQERHKNDREIREELRDAVWARSVALRRLGRPADALKDCDRALGLSTGEKPARLRAARALTLILLGEQARALAEAEALAQAKDVSAGVLYDVACVYAQAAAAAARDTQLAPADRSARAGPHAARAVELLGQARGAGYFQRAANTKRMRQDPDLEVLRPRAEYQKLLTELEKKAGAAAP